VGSIETVEGRSNGLMKDIRNGPKRSGSGSRMIQGKENNLLMAGKEIRCSRGASERQTSSIQGHCMSITKPKIFCSGSSVEDRCEEYKFVFRNEERVKCEMRAVFTEHVRLKLQHELVEQGCRDSWR